MMGKVKGCIHGFLAVYLGLIISGLILYVDGITWIAEKLAGIHAKVLCIHCQARKREKRMLCMLAYANGLCNNECLDCPVDVEETKGEFKI